MMRYEHFSPDQPAEPRHRGVRKEDRRVRETGEGSGGLFEGVQVLCFPFLTLAGVNVLWAEALHRRTGGRWLHVTERDELERMRTAAKQRHRLAGRAAAKIAVQVHLARSLENRCSWEQICIRNRSEGPRAGEPLVRIDSWEERTTPSLSLSHSHDYGLAMTASGGKVGIDLERIEARHPSLIDEAFTREEQERLRLDLGLGETREARITLWWCMKEALLKMLGTGLRIPLLGFQVMPDPVPGEPALGRLGSMTLYRSVLRATFLPSLRSDPEPLPKIVLPLVLGIGSSYGAAALWWGESTACGGQGEIRDV